jgi:hypothetical protein
MNLSHLNAVPQITIDGELVIGFNEAVLRQKLGLTAASLSPTTAPITAASPPPTTLPPTTIATFPPLLPAESPVNNLAPNPSFEVGGGSPSGWVPLYLGTDASFLWQPNIGFGGGYGIGIRASRPANQGWPAWETEAAIPIDPNNKYDFTAYYYVPDVGLLWMDIRLIDSAGRTLGWISTGTSSTPPPPGTWQMRSLTLDPGALYPTFKGIAAVKLGLRLSMNYDVAGLAANTLGTIYYDYVSLLANGQSTPVVPPTTTLPTPYIPAPTTTYPANLGRIVVINRTAPAGYSFNLSMSYGAMVAYPNGLRMPDGFQVDSGFQLTPGVYTITETPTAGWLLSASISDPSGGSSLNGNVVTVNLAGGETVVVTLINTRTGG